MESTALITLDTEIVSSTKADQAVWILTEARKSLDDIMDRYSLLDVTDDATKVQAEHGVMEIVAKVKAIDEQRKEWGRPLDLVKKTMDSAVRQGFSDPMQGIKDSLTQKVSAYTRQLDDERRAREEAARKAAEEANRLLMEAQAAAEAKARAEAEANHVEFVPPPPVGIPEVVVRAEPMREVPTAEGISYRRVWGYEVEDIAKVPDAYTVRVVNDEAIKAAIKAATFIPAGEKLSQCNAAIPGIRIYYEDRPVVGGR